VTDVPDPDPFEVLDERVDVEIIVGASTCSLTLTGTDIRCAQETVSSVVTSILNAKQRNRRLNTVGRESEEEEATRSGMLAERDRRRGGRT